MFLWCPTAGAAVEAVKAVAVAVAEAEAVAQAVAEEEAVSTQVRDLFRERGRTATPAPRSW